MYVGLWDEIKGRVRSSASRLSIGQQQRLCLARGLAIEPEYILGDEATSALDPISTRRIEELFIKLKEKYTVILVTHTLRQARRIADHIIFMYLGEIIESGPTDEFFGNPKKSAYKGLSVRQFQLVFINMFIPEKRSFKRISFLIPVKPVLPLFLTVNSGNITFRYFNFLLILKVHFRSGTRKCRKLTV